MMIMDHANLADVMNLDEASRYLRIKRRTLYSLAARGEVPAAKIGGQWRFRRSQLDGLFGGAPQGVVPLEPRAQV